jgi:serpin B
MLAVHSSLTRTIPVLLGAFALFGSSLFAQDRPPRPPGPLGPPTPRVAVPPGDFHLRQLTEGNAAFALDLYARLRDEEGNLFIAPHSLSTALAMTYAGARGETARQMASALHFDLPEGVLHPAFNQLEESLLGANAGGAGPELYLANRLWGQRGADFRDPFLVTARVNYAGGFEPVDFAGATDRARRTINTWIEAQTKDRIKELLQAGDIDAATVMVLTNAVYFKGTWLYRFDEQFTRARSFSLDEGESVTVPFMGLAASLPYVRSELMQAVELPYEGERLSMVLLVPNEVDGLADLEASLTPANLRSWLAGLRECDVHFSMPRFTLDDRFYLEKTLAAMGMPLAFTPGRADLSGICDEPGELWIDKVIHQTYIAVDEEGTEAAAATAVTTKRKGGYPTIRADRPFLFLIRDRQTGAILFLGRVADPR